MDAMHPQDAQSGIPAKLAMGRSLFASQPTNVWVVSAKTQSFGVLRRPKANCRITASGHV